MFASISPAFAADEVEEPALQLAGAASTGIAVTTTSVELYREFRVHNLKDVPIQGMIDVLDLAGPGAKPTDTTWKLNGTAKLELKLDPQRSAVLSMQAKLPESGDGSGI